MNKKHIFLIIFCGVLAYGNTLFNGFVADDSAAITDNSFVHSWVNFHKIFDPRSYLVDFNAMHAKSFLKENPLGSGEYSYRPVVTISHFIDYAIWGENPFGYHLTKLILHIANSVLLYFLLFIIFKNSVLSFFSALFFIAHPIHTEVVNTATFRGDLFAAFFYISAFIFFIKYKDYTGIKKAVFYFLSLVSYFLGLFSKEVAITLPVVILLYDNFFSPDENKKIFPVLLKTKYLGYILVSVFYLFIYFFVFSNPARPYLNYNSGNFYTGFLTQVKIFAFYVEALFIPHNGNITSLPMFYCPGASSLKDPQVFVSLCLFILIISAAFKFFKELKIVSFCILWFLVTLAPVSGIIPLYIKAAQRYLYIPSIGFCILLGFLTQLFIDFVKSKKIKYITSPGILVVGPILLFYISTDVPQNVAYKNDYIFNQNIIDNFPLDSSEHYLRLGHLYLKDKMPVQALVNYNIAISFNPHNHFFYLSLGRLYYELKDKDRALLEFKKALKLKPDSAQAYINIGAIYGEKGDHKKAISYFKKALKIDPYFCEAYGNLASAYANICQFEKAFNILNKAIKAFPGYRPFQDSLEILEKQRQPKG